MDPQMADTTRAQWEAIASIEKTQERVVTVLDTISARLTTVEASLPSAALLDQTVRRLDDLEDDVNQAAKPNYTAMGFGLSVVIALGGLVSIGFNSKLDHISAYADRQQETLHDHMDGHPERVEAKIDANKEAIEQQISRNQRAMDNLETRFEHEFDRARDRLERLERRSYQRTLDDDKISDP